MTVPRRVSADQRFVDFVSEREQVRLRRLGGQLPPWTTDHILGLYRFTNVRRRDDRVSLWLRDNVYSLPAFAMPSLAAIQFAALCRWVNWPPSIAAMLDPEAGIWSGEHLNLRAVGRLLDHRTKSGKTWTGAYMIRADPHADGGKGKFVAEQVVGRSLRRAWPELQFMLQTGMRRPVWRVFVDCLNWGSFMAGQVVDDLTWTPLLAHPRDNYTWAPQGPGSLRGLNRVLGLPLGTAHEEFAWCEHLQRLRRLVLELPWSDYGEVTLMDVQNCLCEMDKYERVRLGQGRPRSLYHPETAY